MITIGSHNGLCCGGTVVKERSGYIEELNLPAIIQVILSATHFENKIHSLAGTSHEQKLAMLGVAPSGIYCSIAPEIKVKLLGLPNGYNGMRIDLRNFREGRRDCEHMPINLYWETGGDSFMMGAGGSGHNYRMCCKCGHSPIIKRPGILSKLMGAFK